MLVLNTSENDTRFRKFLHDNNALLIINKLGRLMLINNMSADKTEVWIYLSSGVGTGGLQPPQVEDRGA